MAAWPWEPENNRNGRKICGLRRRELPRTAGHPFYERLNELLEETGFDSFVEERCRRFYAAKMGRPSLAPGVYFRLLLIGYFEGLDSERGIAWRAADSLGLRRFLRIGLEEAPPDHSTISRTRRLIDVETHRDVFTWVLGMIAGKGLLAGKTLGIDATTLEANAALRSIVRRESGESYAEFLTRLAKEIGDRDADAGGAGAAGPEAEAEGIEPGVGEPARCGGAHHEDERWADAPGAQGGTCRRPGDGSGSGGDGARGGPGRHDDDQRNIHRGRRTGGGGGGRTNGG